jgi:hypothetical protein
MIGLAAGLALAAASAPAMAGCGSCAPAYSYSYSSCAQAYSPCSGSWGYARLPAPVQYYAVQPQYYYVNQGPTYTGPGMFAPAASYQQRAVAGWSGYSQGYYGYNGGPYANPTHHYYHGMPAVSGPTVYSYRRAYRQNVRYGASRYYAPRYSAYAPRVYRAHRHGYAPRYGYAPRVYRAPRPSVRYGHQHFHAPRYSIAPHQHGHQHQRVLRRYN